jgi:hypothetical protein
MPNTFDRLVDLVRLGMGWKSDVPPFRSDETEVWTLARQHKVGTLLCASSVGKERGNGLVEDARIYWELAALREEYYKTKCREIQSKLTENGIVSSPLKGVALAGEAYPRPGLRPFRDLDLLVRPADVRRTDELLKTLIYKRVTPEGPLARAVKARGDPLAAAAAGIDAVSYEMDDLFLEIHTSIVPPMLGDYPVSLPLSSEDFLVHLLFHATRHHFLFGLRHLVDVAVWCETKKPNWDLVEEKVTGQSLMQVAWPAWKLAHDFFPERVPAPPTEESQWIKGYAQRVLERLEEMPRRAIDLSGSPLPFLLANKKPFKALVRTLRGNETQAVYQIANTKPIALTAWRLRRPFGLAWRHAPVLWSWMKFTFRPSTRGPSRRKMMVSAEDQSNSPLSSLKQPPAHHKAPSRTSSRTLH